MTLWKDPIVEEVHRARAKLLAHFGGDMEKLMDHLEAQQAAHPERIVTGQEFKRPAKSVPRARTPKPRKRAS